MKLPSFFYKLKIALWRIASLIDHRPITVSFETTLSCNCNCQHCDLGGIVKNEKRLGPEGYTKIVRELKPLIVQISGGESLLRDDILDIVKATKQFGKLPYVILVTNGVLLNENIYLKLKKAGLDQLSVSLDFPDERHDDFRRHPGLFKHLNEILPSIAKHGFNDIILNVAITKVNYLELPALVKKTEEWNVKISFSAYTPLRTGDKTFAFEKGEDIEFLETVFNQLLSLKKKSEVIVNSRDDLLKTLKFLKTGNMPRCQAGIKFVVVMPDGFYIPCSMKRERFAKLKDLREKFSKKNYLEGCGGCFVSIRCYSEKSIFEEIKSLPQYLKLSKNIFK